MGVGMLVKGDSIMQSVQVENRSLNKVSFQSNTGQNITRIRGHKLSSSIR
jgi:hypothetical protein